MLYCDNISAPYGTGRIRMSRQRTEASLDVARLPLQSHKCLVLSFGTLLRSHDSRCRRARVAA